MTHSDLCIFVDTSDRFWDRVVRSGSGCWEWTGSVDTRGYGHVRLKGKFQRAHRVAYELVHGPLGLGSGHHGFVVMHTCDNRMCCNPQHLIVGTHADNMSDMRAKGRRKGIASGSGNGRAKLTPEQVAAIRADTRGKRTIAPEFGISPAQVQRIRKGYQWR